MKTLLTLDMKGIIPGSPDQGKPEVDASNYKIREAARAVLLDESGQVYLLYVGKHGYHKLPGGGIDEGETIIQALERELMEEVGCRAEIIAELGSVLEYRRYDDGGLKQTSYCYLAKQVGEQVEASLESGEIEEGLTEVKASSIDDAIALLEKDEPDNLEGKFIQERDLIFLREARARS